MGAAQILKTGSGVLTRRQALVTGGSLLLAGSAARPARATAQDAVPPVALPHRFGIAMHGQARHEAGLTHWPFVNPDAPRGGRLVQTLQGTFDSLNPLIVRGVAPDAVPRFVLQSLLYRSPDEPFSLYGLLAQSFQVADDRRLIIFHLDPDARFSDGRPVTADDVAFSCEMLRTHGKPFHRGSFGRIERMDVRSARTIAFHLGARADRETALIVGLMPVFARHATDPDRFAETSFTPLLGSGPYRVAQVRPGESLTLERRSDFWGDSRPVMRGLNNFVQIRYDFYRDSNALFEAFKAGLSDLRIETDPTQWTMGYDIPAVRDGRILRRGLTLATPKGMSGLVFNTRRSHFADRRVRQALALMFDFEWINRNLFHGAYRRSDSFFAHSELSAAGQAATELEHAALASAGAVLDEPALQGQSLPQPGDGSGRDRDRARQAIALLRQAGYALREGVMGDIASGAPLSFEITVLSRPQERLALTYAKSLERIGVSVRIRLIDDVQFWRRLAAFDFDMVQWQWPVSASPGIEQMNRFGSASARRSGSLNLAGVADAAVDRLIASLLSARDRDHFVAAARALDRVLMAGHYVIPLFYLPDLWIAHRHDVRWPARPASFAFHLEALWRDPEVAPENRPPRAGDKSEQRNN